MKTHTNDFKNGIKELGRELDSIITYTIESVDYELGMEELNSVTPHYESSILKSAMKQLDIDSNVDIPLKTVVNYQFGIKIRDEEVEDYRDNYDYIDFGNYVVYSSEKQEDTNSYKIVCYDKMLYSMKDYEDLSITYPITIRNYINTICTYLGLTFKNSNDTFANYDKEISRELFLDEDGNSLGYTFRDVLDQLAEVTASTICINEEDDELEIRYINDTEDTIDEEYLKDINVNFGEKYGPINSIVLSRSAGSDNVYLQDEDSIELNGLCEIKIIDNQIMNGNDRDTYLQDILDTLDGLEYYINDFSSPGICYYNMCDKYNISIGETTYNCIMFNDEILVTQGLEENVHTDRPEEAETDYTKSDKTDRKINQTNLIVDKQQGEINALASSIQDLTDYLKVVEGTDSLTLTDTPTSNGAIGRLEISGFTNLTLYPDMTYPSDNSYPGTSTAYTIVQTNEDDTLHNETTVILPYPLISTDKLIIENNRVYIKRINADLDTELEVILNTYEDQTIIYVKNFDDLTYKCEYIIKNDFTKYFSTEAELKSQIKISSDGINSKVSKADLISEINQSAEEIKINANKISLEGYTTINDGFSVDLEGNMTCKNATVTGGSLELFSESATDYSQFSVRSNEHGAKYMSWIASDGITIQDRISEDNYSLSASLVNQSAIYDSINTPALGIRCINNETGELKYFSRLTMGNLRFDKYNDITGVSEKYTNITANEITSNGMTFGKQTLLWSGVSYMNGTQSVDLTNTPISSQPHGIILVWSAYVSSQAQNYDWVCNFIPKSFVSYQNGNGMLFNMSNSTFSFVGSKYVYISNTGLSGSNDNTATGTGSGISYKNNHWVLRYVIGV